MADRKGLDLRRRLACADRFSESATCRALFFLNTPLSRSSASLRFMTPADHLRSDFALGRTDARMCTIFGCLVPVAIADKATQSYPRLSVRSRCAVMSESAYAAAMAMPEGQLTAFSVQHGGQRCLNAFNTTLAPALSATFPSMARKTHRTRSALVCSIRVSIFALSS
jgi:hypothetical protein